MRDRRVGSEAKVPEWAGKGIRLTALGVCLLEVAGALAGSALGPGVTGVEFGLITVLQGIFVVAAAVALLWRKHWLGVALSAVSTALSLTVQSIGSDHLLWLLIGVIAGLRGGWPVRFACLVTGALVGGLTGLRTSELNPGWGLEAGAFQVLLVVAGLLIGRTGELALGVISRSRHRARELGLEAEDIRRLERARLAGDLQELLEDGLGELQELCAKTTRQSLEDLRAALTSVDEMNRRLLGQTRQLLHALREPDGMSTHSASRQADTRGRRSLGLRIGLVAALFVTGLMGLLAGGAFTASWLQFAACMAAAVTIWRVVPGVLASAGCLLANVVLVAIDLPAGLWGALSSMVICLAVARYWHKLLVPTASAAALLVLYFVASALTGPIPSVNGDGQGWLHGYGAIAGFFVGISWWSLQTEGKDAESIVARTMKSRDGAIEQERQTLARELHDVVAYQLSITTMMIMACSASNERLVLIGVLDKLKWNIDSARGELHALLQGLRSTEATGPLVTPQRMAQQLSSELTDAGFEVQMDLDAAADNLEPAQLRTVVRAMQEASSNILRYALPATLCIFHLRTDRIQTSLEIISSLSERPRHTDLSNGMGLRGIRERVDLLSGSFRTGPQQDRWSLSIQLPHSEADPPLEGSALAVAQQATRPRRQAR